MAAAADGGRWLKRHQHDNGSFSGNGARNANSTGLAAQALTAVGRDNAAAAARGFLRDLQVMCGGKAADRGLIRYARKDRTATRFAPPARRFPHWPRPPWPTSATTGPSAGCPRWPASRC